MTLFRKLIECSEHPEHYLEIKNIGIKSPEFPKGVGIETLYCPISKKYYSSGNLITKEELESKIENSQENYKKGDIEIIEDMSKLVHKTNQ